MLGFGKAGGYRVLSEMASAWVRGGHTVDFLAPDTSGTPYFPTLAGVIWTDDKGSVSSSGEGRDFSARPGWRLLLALYRGTKQIGNEYDIVLANHSFTPWVIWIARLVKPLNFYYIQAYEPEYYYLEKRPIHWIISRLSYFLPFHQITNAEIYSKYIGISDKNVVPFGIDLNTFWRKQGPSTLANKDKIVIGCIGRAEPAKGTTYVLEAFEKIWAIDKRYRLRIAYGGLPDAWTHEAAEIVTPKNDTELAAFYRSVDILVAAGTVQHGAPHYPVLEGMASGLPVVHTGYLPGNDKNSWLTQNKDANSIVAQVMAVTFHHNLSEKLKFTIDDVRAFAWDSVANLMLDIFLRISTKKKGLQPPVVLQKTE